MNGIEQFIASVLLLATPMVFGSLGACLSERGGIINLGIEGYMIAGAWAAALAQSFYPSTSLGFAMAALAGGVLGVMFALLVVVLRAPVIVTGFAISMLALAFTAHHGRSLVGLPIQVLAGISIPLLSDVPVLGRSVFSQPPTFFLLLGLAFGSAWVLQRTTVGIHIKSTGDSATLARRYGVPVDATRIGLCCATGVLAGLGGGHLLMCVTAVWTEKMTAGQGWIALALVVLSRWNPKGVLLAGYAFGAVLAAQYLFQALNWQAPSQLFASLPYLAAIFAVILSHRQTDMPASLRHTT
jgi:ABC-type uncharacterized transport system permease subunit